MMRATSSIFALVILAVFWLAGGADGQTCGDCDGSGAVTVLDVLLIAQVDSGARPSPSPCGAQFSACNVQGALCPSATAALNILDALRVAQAAAGIPPALSCGTPVGEELMYLGLAAAPLLPSTADTLDSAIVAWTLQVTDTGGDGLPALLRGLTLRPGPGNLIANWRTALSGAELRDGGGATLAVATIAPASLAFGGFALPVPEGGSVLLEVRLAASAVPGALTGWDGCTMVLGLAPADLGTSPAGSAIAAGQPAADSGAGNLIIAVECTALSFLVQPARVAPVLGNFGPITIACHDHNENFDGNATGQVTLSRQGGTGLLASTDPGGLVKTMAGGLVQWANLTLSAEALFQVAAATPAPGWVGLSDFVAVTSSPRIISVEPTDGPAEGGNYVVVRGLGFASAAALSIDGVAATDVQVLSSGLATGSVPAAGAGRAGASADVVLGTLTAAGAYRYFPDTSGPTVIATLPRQGQGSFAASQRFAFLLGSRLDAATVTDPTAGADTSTALSEGGAFIAGMAEVSEDGRWIVLRRSSGSFTPGAQVGACLFGAPVGNAVADPHGNPVGTTTTVAGRAAMSVTTAISPMVIADATPPQVIGSVPEAGATAVPRSATLEVTFSEPINPATARAATVDLLGPAPASGWLEVTADARRLRFHLDAPLQAQASYQLQLHGGGAGGSIQDLAGNNLAFVSIDFTTSNAPILAVTACSPAVGPQAGGTAVHVFGEGFAPGAQVSVGGVPVFPVSRLSRSELWITMPAAAIAGARDVIVTNLDGTAATGRSLWRYDASHPTDSFAPELLFEFPRASSAGTNPCARGSAIVLVMSEPMDIDPDATTIGPGEAIELEADTGAVTRLATDPRILVLEKTSNFTGPPTAFLMPSRLASPQRGVRDVSGNRLLVFHPDRRFGLLGGEPTLGLSWSDGGNDVSSPSYAVRSPLPASTGNGSLARIDVFLSEPANPRTVEVGFAVTDAAGAVPGELIFDLETLRGWWFRPDRPLAGVVTVDATLVEDLSGNPVGGSPYSFSVVADTSVPQIERMTINGIPDYLNGDLASGGGSAIGGRLRVPPTGFTIDIEFGDVGGQVSTARDDFTITCTQPVGGLAPGTNLAPFFPPGYFHADEGRASFLVPPNLPFPAGLTDASAVVASIGCRVRDEAGNSSAQVGFIVDCVVALADHVPLDGSELYHVEVFRNHDDLSYDLAGYSLLSPGSEGCPAPDGEIDFSEDSIVHGLASFPPDWNPNGTGMVASGALTMNQAAANWVINRVLFHLHRLYGQAMDWSDGHPNPGFAAVRTFAPSDSFEAADIRFAHAAQPPGSEANRIALGGFKTTGVAGFAGFDGQNRRRNDDIGETCFLQNTGVFTTVDADIEFDGSPSSPGGSFRILFDPVTPFTGGAAPRPLGNDPDDAFACDPAVDPSGFAGARADRYRQVLAALDAFASRQAYLAAHEVGHSLGLIEDGDPGMGLYGNDTAAFPGSTSAHVALRSFYLGDGSNLMAPLAFLDASVSRHSAFNALALAYLQGRSLVVH